MGFLVNIKNALSGRRSSVNSKASGEGYASAPQEKPAAEVTVPSNTVETPAVTKGAYLVFSPASNGTLFIVWSLSPVEGAMAFFEPKKPVADFKYKDKGGKSEIVRNMMQDKAKYYDGWCQFFKIACEHHGSCKLLADAENAPLKVEVAFLDGIKVKRLMAGSSLQARNITAIGCVPFGDNGFQVHTLQKDVFLRNSRRGGAAITL